MSTQTAPCGLRTVHGLQNGVQLSSVGLHSEITLEDGSVLVQGPCVDDSSRERRGTVFRCYTSSHLDPCSCCGPTGWEDILNASVASNRKNLNENDMAELKKARAAIANFGSKAVTLPKAKAELNKLTKIQSNAMVTANHLDKNTDPNVVKALKQYRWKSRVALKNG